MLKNLITNWKTTSAGLTLIIGSITHLIFAMRSKTADEAVWTTALLGIVTGVGLILAGDAGASATKDEVGAVKAQVDLNTTVLKTGDTSILSNPTTKKGTP